MKSVSPVLPHHPEFQELVLAESQEEYLNLAVAVVVYSDGTRSMISCYRLTWFERIKLLVTGSLWLEQLVGDGQLQPQRPTVNEPLTESDQESA